MLSDRFICGRSDHGNNLVCEKLFLTGNPPKQWISGSGLRWGSTGGWGSVTGNSGGWGGVLLGAEVPLGFYRQLGCYWGGAVGGRWVGGSLGSRAKECHQGPPCFWPLPLRRVCGAQV